jgi:hypothetical protein
MNKIVHLKHMCVKRFITKISAAFSKTLTPSPLKEGRYSGTGRDEHVLKLNALTAAVRALRSESCNPLKNDEFRKKQGEG